MASESRKTLACAVYTRKSSEEGLEQEFNSLDAQREACEAFILSQRHEGWKVVSTLYDDGGFSGGNMDRPALNRLMNDIRDRKVDVVVVYKVDRLTRSLSDFAKIVEVFDAQGVSFVSVTQQFNTTSSMGRLTLNVLLSFAQFEREVTGERIRDKIAASKKKGMFMGGGFPLGYDLNEHRLVVNETEAKAVRKLFALYVELRRVRRVQAEAAKLGILSKVRTSEAGRTWGGEQLTRGPLYYILRNRTYLGEILHKSQIYAGQHDAISDRTLWDQVQEILAGNAQDLSDGKNSEHPSPLAGLLFDERGNRLTPSHTQRGSVRYRYYVSQAVLKHEPEKVGPIKRVPAVGIEALIVEQVQELLSKPIRLIQNLVGDEAASEDKQTMISAASKAAARFGREEGWGRLAFARTIINEIVVRGDAVEIWFNRSAFKGGLGLMEASASQSVQQQGKTDDCFAITVQTRITRSGRQKRMIIADDNGDHRLINADMRMAVARAIKWDQEIRTGTSPRQIAKREDLSAGYVSRVLPLAFLAPDIVQAIYEGRQPCELKVKGAIRESSYRMGGAASSARIPGPLNLYGLSLSVAQQHARRIVALRILDWRGVTGVGASTLGPMSKKFSWAFGESRAKSLELAAGECAIGSTRCRIRALTL